MTSTVRIAWDRDFENTQRWNEVCVWAIEYFGLPGDRFHTRANVNHMEFIFTSDKDALMMSLMWNAPIVTDDELTVEFVGSMINGL
jgi:hypothetical protein